MELTISEKELDRITVLRNVEAKSLSLVQAGEVMGLSTWHVSRILKKLATEGPSGIISQKRGKPSNRIISQVTKDKVLEIIDKDYSRLIFN